MHKTLKVDKISIIRFILLQGETRQVLLFGYNWRGHNKSQTPFSIIDLQSVVANIPPRFGSTVCLSVCLFQL